MNMEHRQTQTLHKQGFGAEAIVAKYPPPNSPNVNPLDYCVGCNASGISQTSPKAKDHSGTKSALQQIRDDLPQTVIKKDINDFCKRLNAHVAAGGDHFEHMI